MPHLFAEEIRSLIESERRKVGNERPATDTDVWYHEMMLLRPINFRSIEVALAAMLIMRDPPRALEYDKPRSDRAPRVLLLRTGRGQRLTEDLATLCDSHGVPRDARVTYCSEPESFWSAFFGCDDFVGQSQERDTPALMIATGLMKSHCTGMGMIHTVTERLHEISARWKVPIEFVTDHA